MVATASNVNRLFSRVADLTDAPKLGGGKLLWVDAARGDDATAQRGRREAPFKTCGLAKTLAQSGDTIIVQPGAYNETNLAKNGVNWHFQPGATVAYVAVLTDSTPVSGIFDDGGAAMTFEVTGDGQFTMSLTESAPNVANHIDVWAVSITGASTVRIQGRKINAVTAFRSSFLTINTGKSVRQSAGTLVLMVDDPNDVTINAGTARIVTNGTNASVTAAGGTVDVFGAVIAAMTCTAGSLSATFDTCTVAVCSGGTMRLTGQRVDNLNWSGGDLHETVAHVGHLAGTASSGTGDFTTSRYGNGDNEAINFSQSGTAEAFLNAGSVTSTAAPCVTFAGGKIRARGMDVRSTAPTGSHGTDIAIGVGDVAGVNATDLTMTDMLVRVNDSTHSCWRVYSESPLGSTYRVTGGMYQAGATGFWFDPEAARTVNVQGEVTTNRPAGPFATLAGAGTIVTDPALSL
jgi:hypothetical protein